MDLQVLRNFVAVAASGSVRRAAEQVHISQPALTRQVQGLERELGARLLFRSSRGMTPTAVGWNVYRQAAALLLEHEVLTAAVAGPDVVVVGYHDPGAATLVPHVLRRLRDGQPDLSLRPVLRPTAERDAGVASGAVDLGLVRTPPDTAGVASAFLHWERQVYAVPADAVLARQPLVAAAELDGYPFLGRPLEPPPRGQPAGRPARPWRPPQLSLEECLVLVACGAVAMVPESVAATCPRPNVGYRPTAEPTAVSTLRLLWRPRLSSAATVAAAGAVRAVAADSALPSLRSLAAAR